MIEKQTWAGTLKWYSYEEAKDLLAPLRNQIFDIGTGLVRHGKGSIFLPDGWMKIIIRGALFYSDRSKPPDDILENDEELLCWARDDPRDELLPLLELLVEDGIGEVIQMSPWTSGTSADAVTTAPTASAVRSTHFWGGVEECTEVPERLLFDSTGRWGFYASEEQFGLLGGEPEFMNRYIDRVGGMEFIRQKADLYWQAEIENNGFEAQEVPLYYKSADWDDPPQPKSSSDK